MQRDNPKPENQAKTTPARITITSKTSTRFFDFQCTASGHGTIETYEVEGKKKSFVKFRLDEMDPKNSNLCAAKFIEGIAEITKESKTTAEIKADLDVGGYNQVKFKKAVPYTKNSTHDAKHVTSEFDISKHGTKTNCELKVSVPTPRQCK